MADLTVRNTATENASGVFREVAAAATQTADELERAGTDGAKGLEKIEQEAREAAPAVESVGDSAKRAGVDLDKMGAALVAIGAGLAYAGQLAMDHERMIVGLQKAYGDSAAEMIAFADTLSTETGNLFNDDDILAGERFFATLRNNYGLTIAEIQEVARITADLAAASGVSYEDAANRVTAALRGEAEAAEYLGLTMNQAAIDREGLTLTMSNQEAAQFRLNALQEQSAVYMGTASAVAKTSAGDWAALTNQFKDAAQGIGEFIGPYGSMIAGLGAGAVGLAQFAGGFTALASGIRIATTASLAFAATPVGVAVLAVGAGLALATSQFMEHRNEVKAAEEQYRSMIEAAADLTAQIADLRLEDWADADWAKGLKTAIENELTWQENWLQDSLMKSFGTGDWFDQMVLDLLPGNILPGELQAAWELQASSLVEAMIPDDADRAKITTAFSDILSLRDVKNINFDAIQGEVDRLFAAFNASNGAITAEQFNAQLVSLYENNLQAAQAIDMTTLAINNLSAAQETWSALGAGSIGEMTTDMTALEDATLMTAAATRELALAERERKNERGEAAKEAAAEQDAFWEEQRSRAEADQEADKQRAEDRRASAMEARAEFKAMALEQLAIREKLSVAIQTNAGLELSLVSDMKAAYADLAAARQEELRGMLSSATGMDNPLDQFNASSMASGASELAQNLRDAGVAAGDLFRVIVGNTDAIKSQADATLNWATELINVRGELGIIDDLLSQGLIDESQYDAAQNAYDSIAISTATITDNLNAIQAIQSPLIAAMQEDQAAYTAELLKQPAAVQLTALAWMDAATASRAFEIQALAASAATGELGTNGVAAMTSYIDSIVRAEPATAALLEQLGLITNVVRDSSGMIISYEIDIAGAEGAQSEISLLTDAINMLTAAILGIPVAELNVQDNATATIEEATTSMERYDGKVATGYVVGNNSNAMGVIDESTGALNALNGDTATVTVNGNDLASGVLGGVAAMLNALDGRTATTYVRTVNYGGGGGLNERMGGVPGFEQGGVTFYGGEGNRPELARFANGGVSVIPHEGFWNVPPATRIVPNNGNNYGGGGGGVSLTVNINAPVYGVEDLDNRLADFAYQLADAQERNRLSVGVY